MSEIEAEALVYVRTHPGARASDIGWALWGDTTPYPERGEGSHGQNKFCRPAGKVLLGLQRKGLVYWRGLETYAGWWAASQGGSAR